MANGLRQPEPSPLPMVEHLLHASPVSAAGIDVVRAALTEIGEAWPSDRPLRVLEIGAEGAVTLSSTPEEYGAIIGAELAKWGPVVKASGFKPE